MATIGDAIAPSQNTINYDDLLTTTLFNYQTSGALADNIFKDSAFLAGLRLMNGIDEQAGGERIAIPLMYAKNQTVKSYENYDVLDTTPRCSWGV